MRVYDYDGFVMLSAVLSSGFLASYWLAGFGKFLQVSALASYWLKNCANFTPTPKENNQCSANYVYVLLVQCKQQANPFYQWVSRNYKNKQLVLFSQRKLALIARNTHFAIKNHWSTKKLKKNGPVLFLGLKLTIHVIKSQIHLARQSL